MLEGRSSSSCVSEFFVCALSQQRASQSLDLVVLGLLGLTRCSR